ncbi:MAG TPA: hypothetical protein VGR10_04880 [Thermoleophilaceae bacterium]|nr:hypothetical protein [Thermoleophilaceae bacterium]
MGDTATAAAAPQHLLALEHANRVRLARADLKRRIGAGSLTAAAVLADPPPEVQSMSISELLMSQRRWGRARCRRLLVPLGIPENKRVGTLTDRQRSVLSALLAPKPGASEHGARGRSGELAAAS